MEEKVTERPVHLRAAQKWSPAATPRLLVKICGLTRPDDVALAAELGAWALGFVLAPSARRVTPAQARELAAAGRSADRRGASGCRPLTVGVFVDEPADEIAETVATAGLSGVQLHALRPGAVSIRKALVAALGDKAAEVVVIQAVPVAAGGADPGVLRQAVASADKGADLLLFDTRSGGRFGGTGTAFPWDLAREAAAGRPFLVAGGLGPHNVAEALAVSGARGVDVSSGVETAPGTKDPDALRGLFAALEGC
jgi:phosphoribosylanthranilate isomerase